MKRSYIPAALGLVCLTLLAAPAQAGWRDWLGLGKKIPSEDSQQEPGATPPAAAPSSVHDEVLPEWADFSKTSVEIIIKVQAIDGEQSGLANLCETRRTEAKACSMSAVVPRSFARGPHSGPNTPMEGRRITVNLRRFAEDNSMVQLWLLGDGNVGIMQKRLDASVNDLIKGISIPVSEERGYGSKTPDIPSVPSGTVFVKIQKP